MLEEALSGIFMKKRRERGFALAWSRKRTEEAGIVQVKCDKPIEKDHSFKGSKAKQLMQF